MPIKSRKDKSCSIDKFSSLEDATDWMLVSLQNAYVGNYTPMWSYEEVGIMEGVIRKWDWNLHEWYQYYL